MEEFKAPMREIEERFTRSELVLLAWRSQEMHHNFKKKRSMYEDLPDNEAEVQGGKRRKTYPDGIGPEGMPDKFYDANGDFNLSLVTGEEARRYFAERLGIPMPRGVSKIGATDSTTQQIRQAYGIRG